MYAGSPEAWSSVKTTAVTTSRAATARSMRRRISRVIGVSGGVGREGRQRAGHQRAGEVDLVAVLPEGARLADRGVRGLAHERGAGGVAVEHGLRGGGAIGERRDAAEGHAHVGPA